MYQESIVMAISSERDVRVTAILCPECEKIRIKLHRLTENELVWYEEHLTVKHQMIR